MELLHIIICLFLTQPFWLSFPICASSPVCLCWSGSHLPISISTTKNGLCPAVWCISPPSVSHKEDQMRAEEEQCCQGITLSLLSCVVPLPTFSQPQRRSNEGGGGAVLSGDSIVPPRPVVWCNSLSLYWPLVIHKQDQIGVVVNGWGFLPSCVLCLVFCPSLIRWAPKKNMKWRQ